MAKPENVRKFLAGGFADFILYLIEQPDPIIVGGGYSNEKLIDVFTQWAADRNFNTDNADLAMWREACRLKQFGD